MSHFEELLGLPLSSVLPVLQHRFTTTTTYFGVPCQRVAFDSWSYQEILWDTKPDVIVEIGVFCGGNALALAHLCDALGKGRVIAVEIQPERIAPIVRAHPRITVVEGDALAKYDDVAKLCAPEDHVMVIEDSSHTYANTFGVLTLYSQLVKPGDYFVVEDTICQHGLRVGYLPGPYEAVQNFVSANPNFVIDREREFPITWNPSGFLKRVS